MSVVLKNKVCSLFVYSLMTEVENLERYMIILKLWQTMNFITMATRTILLFPNRFLSKERCCLCDIIYQINKGQLKQIQTLPYWQGSQTFHLLIELSTVRVVVSSTLDADLENRKLFTKSE